MKLETTDQNKKRRDCHKYIREYVKEWSRDPDLRTTGTITVQDVNNELDYYEIDFLTKFGERIHCNCDSNYPCFINYGLMRNHN